MKISIIGMGYVGIQLASAFGQGNETIGFDLDRAKLDAYRSGEDPTGEVSKERLTSASHLLFSDRPADLTGSDIYIVAVPTPIDIARRPDLEPLIKASKLVGSLIEKGATVVYESTVYPGATEEICVPILESESQLKWRSDFHVGYSPERINPGDPTHTLETVTKVVSADDEQTTEKLISLYESIIPAGVFRAASIQVAEAAKVIENTQRDLNIALINELAIIFDRLNINTADVLRTAASKWNFLPFQPGLVGGHCIGVDPYYLTHKAQMVGYQPEVILSGRKINDSMAYFIAQKTIRLLAEFSSIGRDTTVNVFGVTFKENCCDFRNSQVFVLVRELRELGLNVRVIDPVANNDNAGKELGIEMTPLDQAKPASACILAVPHRVFHDKGAKWFCSIVERPGVLVDVKGIFREELDEVQNLTYWSL
jgi:UDP-N-acetyl-D-galactosamine dehydrogenase